MSHFSNGDTFGKKRKPRSAGMYIHVWIVMCSKPNLLSRFIVYLSISIFCHFNLPLHFVGTYWIICDTFIYVLICKWPCKVRDKIMYFIKFISDGRQIKKYFDILNVNVIILLIHLTNRAVLNKLIGASFIKWLPHLWG